MVDSILDDTFFVCFFYQFEMMGQHVLLKMTLGNHLSKMELVAGSRIRVVESGNFFKLNWKTF